MLHKHNNIEIDMTRRHDMRTRDKFFKIHTTRVSDTRVGHDTTSW